MGVGPAPIVGRVTRPGLLFRSSLNDPVQAMRYAQGAFLAFATMAMLFIGCDTSSPDAEEDPVPPAAHVEARGAMMQGVPPPNNPTGPSEGTVLSGPVFDLATAPNGSILAVETVSPGTDIPPEGTNTSVVKEISRQGVQEVTEIVTVTGSPINGIETIGRGNFFAASGGLDQAVGAGVWHVTRGNARKVGNVESFEKNVDPDANEGLKWKDPLCEINPSEGFTAGPQSNPYHLARRSGREVLVADAAGNTLLSARTNGTVDWVSILTPPTTGPPAASTAPTDWRVLFPLSQDTNCYVQPVPTAVDVGPSGDYYVGELTGVTPGDLEGNPSTGLSRVWRVEDGARNVICPSDDCEVALDGLTSVIDVEFGPNGDLYVVEYDENGWFASTALGTPAGGTINRCDVETGQCTAVADDLTLPGAIAFDKGGTLWLLENNIGTPTVRPVPSAAP